jgi:mannose-6-phosphate isomerase
LHGFKPVDSLLETLRNTPELVALIGEKRAQMLTIAPDTNSQAVAVKEIYRAVVESTPEQREKNMASFHSRLSAGETNLTWERPHLEKMFATYGSSDVGIPTSLLMNWTQVAPGKAVYMGPNDLHAYLEGDLIECMAASDNVVRAGLTRKFQDRAELLAMVKVLPAPTTIITPKPVRGSSIAARYPSEAAEFQVTAVSGESSLPEDFNTPTVTFVMCTSGVLTVETSGEAMSLPEGQLAMIPACANHFSLGCKGTGFIISVPDLPPQLAPALIRAS